MKLVIFLGVVVFSLASQAASYTCRESDRKLNPKTYQITTWGGDATLPAYASAITAPPGKEPMGVGFFNCEDAADPEELAVCTNDENKCRVVFQYTADGSVESLLVDAKRADNNKSIITLPCELLP